MQIFLQTLRSLFQPKHRLHWIYFLLVVSIFGRGEPIIAQTATPTPVTVEIFLPVISDAGPPRTTPLIGQPIGPLEAVVGQIHRATNRDFGNYLLTNDNLTYGLVGATEAVEQQITTLREQDPPIAVVIWGTAYKIVEAEDIPVIIVERIISTLATGTETPVVAPVATAKFDRINLRAGPANSYGRAGQVVLGQKCTVIGRNQQSSWWEILCSDTVQGWIDSRLVRVAGDVTKVPITEPTIMIIVTPTITPTATLLPTPTAMPTATPASPPTAAWRATFFNNRDLQGTPALVQEIPAINFTWGANPPLAQLPADNFSARFERIINFSDGFYRFSLSADDGVRFWLDDELLLDEWHGTSNRTYTVGRELVGNHRLRIDYYEANGLASLRLLTEFVTAFPEWEATYFNGVLLQGTPVFTQSEARSVNPLEYNWLAASPLPARLGVDNWSARWVGTFRFDFSTYVFRAVADDGVRVYINDQIILDHWRDGYKDVSNRFYSVGAGIHTIRVEYYERAGDAAVRVWWYPDNSAPR